MADHGHTADHGGIELGTASGVDYEAHRQTYLGFLRLVKYSVAGIIILMIFLAWWSY